MRKTDYINCNFNEDVQIEVTPVRIEAHEILKRDSFDALALSLVRDGEIEEDIEYRIKLNG